MKDGYRHRRDAAGAVGCRHRGRSPPSAQGKWLKSPPSSRPLTAGVGPPPPRGLYRGYCARRLAGNCLVCDQVVGDTSCGARALTDGLKNLAGGNPSRHRRHSSKRRCALTGERADVMNICPACGYPMHGPGLCPFCLPIQAITDDLTSQPIFSAVNSPSALPSPPGGMRDARALVTRRLSRLTQSRRRHCPLESGTHNGN